MYQRTIDSVVVHISNDKFEFDLKNINADINSDSDENRSSSSLPDLQNKKYSISLEFEVLKILPFDSNRRRMSIFVINPLINENEEILMFSKGADEAILNKCTQKNPETLRLLKEYAVQGHRTLCIAMRRLKRFEFEEWLKMREFVNLFRIIIKDFFR